MADPGRRIVRRLVRRARSVQQQARSDIGPVVVGYGDKRPFEGESEVDPRLRLARYEPLGAVDQDDRASWPDPVRRLLGMAPEAGGTGRYHTVRPGGLQDAPRVYVFVHGWVPGSRGITEELRVEEGSVPVAWDERVANKVGRSMVEAYEPLLAALAQRDPEAAVLWYSWVDQSGTDTELFAARGSLRYTGVNGRRLAAALHELIGEGRPAVHLIGHSHGSVVATYAALSMQRPPEHLTLLDCPEDWFSRAGGAAGLLSDVLPRLQPRRGPGGTFVDAYASMFGRAYHDDPGLGAVVDVRLAPQVKKSEQASAASQAHQFAVSWYAGTVGDPAAAGGFAWSPLHGFDTAGLGSMYLASAKGRLAEVVRWRPDQSAPLQQVATTIDVPAQDLTRRSPDTAMLMTLPQDAVLLEYDLSVLRPGKDTRVEVAVNGHLSSLHFPAAPLPAQGRFVRFGSERVTLQFRLVEPGYLTAASVTGLRVVQGSAATRNLDDTAAMARIAALSAATGAAAAFGTVAGAVLVRSAVRRIRAFAGR